MSEPFEDSNIFKESLSMWRGIKQVNTDGTYLYEDSDFEPMLLDLFTAASLGEDELMLDILDRKECKPGARNKGGWSSIMYAAYMGHASTTKLLLQAGADPNQHSPRGSTCLILAAMCGNDEVMKILLQNGADIEAKDRHGWTALFHAASSGHQTTTQFLINAGANCEVVELSQGLTPLMEAAASGHEIIVEQFLKKGVDVSRRDKQGNTALALALECEHRKVASLIELVQQRPVHRSSSHYPKHPPVYPQNNNYGSSGGPDIHAGPMAFQKIFNSDGKPQADQLLPIFLQDQQSEPPPQQFQSTYRGPKDLPTLLEDIDCSKYLKKFTEQDIDMRIYLTLNEIDLKAIGINILGPRKKMLRQIARVNNEIKTCIDDRVELAYADSMAAKYQDLQAKYQESEEKFKKMQSLFDQECHLRKVAETVLMEQKETRSSLLSLLDTWKAAQGSLVHLADQFRSICSRIPQNRVPDGNNSRMVDSSILKLSHDFDTILHHTRDCLVGMQSLLKKSSRT